MNNQIILPANHHMVIKINKINKINKLKKIINLKYFWKALISWCLLRREKNKHVWAQSRAQLILKKTKKVKKSVDYIFNIN